MLKKILTGTGVAALLGVVFLMGNIALGPISAQTLPTNNPVQQSQTEVQQPPYSGSIQIADSQYEGMSEADEAASLQSQATITSAQAEAVALAANPGTAVVKIQLDNENGVLVYSVELSNGLDVKVDAGNGKILHTEQSGDDAAEVENAQEQESVED
jgi:uncharacterized membrane protein YkoI